MEPNLALWMAREIHSQAPRQNLPDPNHDRLTITLAKEREGPPEPGGAFEILAQAVLSYDVFGARIGRPIVKRSPVQVGDTIGLVFQPLPFLGMFFASRVVEVFNLEESVEGWRSGFVYQTLESHPEVGEEIFAIIKQPDGSVVFHLEAWSRPNLWYVKLFAPLARLIQRHAAACAARHLAGKIC